MNLVLLCHPSSLGSTSMPRFARMIGEAMEARGHRVRYATSKAIFSGLPGCPPVLRKWLGYLDQFILFPFAFRKQMRNLEARTIFVVTDQALGMWIPMVKGHPHVIHCHDFLAQRSAQGEFPENPTGWTGRQYQALIRRGYRQGKVFISVSKKTQADLHKFLKDPPQRSETIYNPLNYPFRPLPREIAVDSLGSLQLDAENGYILHVGGNQWYKNREGVVAIYRKYCERVKSRPLPLLLVGSAPGAALRNMSSECANGGRVQFASGLSDREVHCAYSLAKVLLFPSLEEGFGWPIAEAQACGCLVITTGCAPMTEVGGDAAFYIPRMVQPLDAWAEQCVDTLFEVLCITPEARMERTEAGLLNAARFDIDKAMDAMEAIYQERIE